MRLHWHTLLKACNFHPAAGCARLLRLLWLAQQECVDAAILKCAQALKAQVGLEFASSAWDRKMACPSSCLSCGGLHRHVGARQALDAVLQPWLLLLPAHAADMAYAAAA